MRLLLVLLSTFTVTMAGLAGGITTQDASAPEHLVSSPFLSLHSLPVLLWPCSVILLCILWAGRECVYDSDGARRERIGLEKETKLERARRINRREIESQGAKQSLAHSFYRRSVPL